MVQGLAQVCFYFLLLAQQLSGNFGVGIMIFDKKNLSLSQRYNFVTCGNRLVPGFGSLPSLL